MTIASQLGVELLGRDRVSSCVVWASLSDLHPFQLVETSKRTFAISSHLYGQPENMETVRFTVCAAGECGQRDSCASAKFAEDACSPAQIRLGQNRSNATSSEYS